MEFKEFEQYKKNKDERYDKYCPSYILVGSP